jgi:DNA-binding transcriptional ArsR family regulator
MKIPPQNETVDVADLSGVDGLSVLQALSDPVRLEIVRQLAGCSGSGELRCGQIEMPVTKSTASHHFKTLYAAGIIAEREQGRSKYMRLRRAELDERFPGLLDSVLQATQAT